MSQSLSFARVPAAVDSGCFGSSEKKIFPLNFERMFKCVCVCVSGAVHAMDDLSAPLTSLFGSV